MDATRNSGSPNLAAVERTVAQLLAVVDFAAQSAAPLLHFPIAILCPQDFLVDLRRRQLKVSIEVLLVHLSCNIRLKAHRRLPSRLLRLMKLLLCSFIGDLRRKQFHVSFEALLVHLSCHIRIKHLRQRS